MNDGGEARWDNLCTFVEDTMEAKGVPGVAVGILCAGKVASAGFGVTNVDHPLPVTDDTLFQIGSITKTFTGAAVVRLVEAGKLALDTPVRTYLPEFKVVDEDASAHATIRHLLAHTGGWEGDYFVDTGGGDEALAQYVTGMSELEQIAPLGLLFSYNNAGFSLAGRVIEVATGKNFRQALQELVLEPLGLSRCFFGPGEVITHRFAVGHRVGEEGAEVARPWPLSPCIWPAGGIICPVKDLLRYAQFHLGDGCAADGTRLLMPETMRAMQSPQVAIRDGEAWGLAWSLEDVGGARTIGHGGGTLGQVTLLTLVPERNFAVAVLTNADRGREVTREVTYRALSEYLGVQHEEPAPIETSAEELAQYASWYRRPYADIELGVLGGRLVEQMIIKQGFPTRDQPPGPPPPPTVLGLCGKDTLLVLEGPGKGTRADIVRRDDGSVGWLRMGRLYRRDA